MEKILKIIEERNVKQKDICKALNLSQSYTSELLNRKKTLSLTLCEKLCDFLNIDIILVDKNRK